ncbi:MAG: type III secretion system chaperone [Duodenibacillus sp.]|nr:type III secretion system chaperone [Duodenibacillus sp.]
MQAEELVKRFCEREGIPFEVNASGSFSLDCDGLTVNIRSHDEGRRLSFAGEVSHGAPGEDCEPLYRAMFEAQHLYAGTFGAVFSINPDTGVLTLFRMIECEGLELEGFFDQLGNFVTVLELWTRVVAKYDPASHTDDGLRPIPFHGFGGAIPV